MINIQELRIGNYVARTAGDMPVTGITSEGLHFADADIENPKYPNPIAITTDILLKCGFYLYSTSKIKTVWDEDYRPTELYSYEDQFYVSYSEMDDDDRRFRHYGHGDKILRSLHELQNTYYHFLSKELIIKLDEPYF